jgi:hypothetical protein
MLQKGPNTQVNTSRRRQRRRPLILTNCKSPVDNLGRGGLISKQKLKPSFYRIRKAKEGRKTENYFFNKFRVKNRTFTPTTY